MRLRRFNALSSRRDTVDELETGGVSASPSRFANSRPPCMARAGQTRVTPYVVAPPNRWFAGPESNRAVQPDLAGCAGVPPGHGRNGSPHSVRTRTAAKRPPEGRALIQERRSVTRSPEATAGRLRDGQAATSIRSGRESSDTRRRSTTSRSGWLSCTKPQGPRRSQAVRNPPP